MSDILLFTLFIIISILAFLLLVFILCGCKVSGECSRKEEQEETIRRIKGQEQKLDDSNWQDNLIYDDEFVRKEDK